MDRLESEAARSRSCTWPIQDGIQPGVMPAGGNGELPMNTCSNGEVVPNETGDQHLGLQGEQLECQSPILPAIPSPQLSKSEPKKMRNPWGNTSYAELITKAIHSSPDERLTLSEIYDWIVKNVPFFSDKANSPSTAGWKVNDRISSR